MRVDWRARLARNSKPAPDDPKVHLTDAEWSIMEVVWQQQPCAAGSVQEALLATRGWAYSTVKTTMDRMVAKGLLTTSSIRNLTLYSASVTRSVARKDALRALMRRAFDGALAPMIQFLVQEEELSAQEVRELRKLLNRKPPTKP